MYGKMGKHCGDDFGNIVLLNHFKMLGTRLFLAVSSHSIVIKKPPFYYFRQCDFVWTEFVYFQFAILATQVNCRVLYLINLELFQIDTSWGFEFDWKKYFSLVFRSNLATHQKTKLTSIVDFNHPLHLSNFVLLNQNILNVIFYCPKIGLNFVG